mmetsp:Transcript_57797/g.102618  ORF Transcript_57797/g.102618 Transcript_57797/m.102618 type:complete len:178 (+) Transcript_57797:49-582(+)
MTASLDELKQALVETLETRGVLGQVKAKVRAEIFAALDDEQVQRPQLPRENALINELIREYFEYNGYHHALSVLLPESGHPEERQFDRQFLASELRVREDERSRSLPLIYSLVRGMHGDIGASGSSPMEDSSAPGIWRSEPVSSAATGSTGAAGSSGREAEVGGDQPPPMVIRGAAS